MIWFTILFVLLPKIIDQLHFDGRIWRGDFKFIVTISWTCLDGGFWDELIPHFLVIFWVIMVEFKSISFEVIWNHSPNSFIKSNLRTKCTLSVLRGFEENWRLRICFIRGPLCCITCMWRKTNIPNSLNNVDIYCLLNSTFKKNSSNENLSCLFQ